jgi:hypothetical protein
MRDAQPSAPAIRQPRAASSQGLNTHPAVRARAERGSFERGMAISLHGKGRAVNSERFGECV